VDLPRVERELKNRCEYPYHWGRKQSDSWDRMTNFIYKTYSMNMLYRKTEHLDSNLRDYAFNRWYNFWSAMAVEDIFASHPNVEPNKNSYDKLIDFSIDKIPFDHKTSVFPKGFAKSFEYAREHEAELIEWLYKHQSQEGRMHLKNRLFIVLYDGKTMQHWKMKAEIMLLKRAIDRYVENFSQKNLYQFDFGDGVVFSDIIWVTRGVK